MSQEAPSPLAPLTRSAARTSLTYPRAQPPSQRQPKKNGGHASRLGPRHRAAAVGGFRFRHKTGDEPGVSTLQGPTPGEALLSAIDTVSPNPNWYSASRKRTAFPLPLARAEFA